MTQTTDGILLKDTLITRHGGDFGLFEKLSKDGDGDVKMEQWKEHMAHLYDTKGPERGVNHLKGLVTALRWSEAGTRKARPVGAADSIVADKLKLAYNEEKAKAQRIECCIILLVVLVSPIWLPIIFLWLSLTFILTLHPLRAAIVAVFTIGCLWLWAEISDNSCEVISFMAPCSLVASMVAGAFSNCDRLSASVVTFLLAAGVTYLALTQKESDTSQDLCHSQTTKGLFRYLPCAMALVQFVIASKIWRPASPELLLEAEKKLVEDALSRNSGPESSGHTVYTPLHDTVAGIHTIEVPITLTLRLSLTLTRITQCRSGILRSPSSYSFMAMVQGLGTSLGT